ncbi:MAG: metallophosphoesterase [Sandaracinaceae bacterium]
MSPQVGMRVAVLALAASSAVPVHAQSARRPYLMSGNENAVTVVWRTTTSGEATSICYGPSPTSLTELATGTATTFGAARQIEVRVTGLSPATRYYYATGESTCPPAAAGDPNLSFRTSPAVGPPTPFRFWVVGDSGTGGSGQAAVFDAMRAETAGDPPDLYLHVGDMAYTDGTEAEFDAHFFAPYAPLLENTVVWPAIGNHENHSSLSGPETGPYYEGYVLPRDGSSGGLPSGTEAYYSFDYANVHFVVLDSADSDTRPTGPMAQWLEMDLAATTQDWIVAYWHHPAYTDGSHVDSEGDLQAMRQRILPIIEAGGVDLVLVGHSHIYERSYPVEGAFYAGLPTAGVTSAIQDMGDGRPSGDGPYDANAPGVVHITAGHGGTGVGGNGNHPLMYFSELANGSVLVDVAGDVLTLRNVRADGAITDDMAIVRGSGIFVITPSGGSYLAGSDVDVTWTASGAGGRVRIEYSLDDGASWNVAIADTENDGAYTWTAPRRETTEGRIRITDTTDASLTGSSPLAFTLSAEADVPAIALGSVWEYADDGTAPPTDWSTTTGAWPSGPAQLGYGDGDEATVLLDADPNVPTVYVRRTIEVDGTPLSAVAHVLFDDGFAIFVNGTLVASQNADDLAHDAYASAQSADNEMIDVDIDPAAFTPGTNVIAVMVKQANASSSDLSFDLALDMRVRVPVDPPDVDAGVGDADGGARRDGGGVRSDGGGAGDAGTGEGGDGCGCRATPRRPTPLGLLLALALFARRRAR